MSGVRSLYRGPTQKGYATKNSAPIRVDDTTSVPMANLAGTGTTEVPLTLAVSTSGARIAAGSGNLVSGAATVATGLTSVLGFQALLNGPTGFATGATEVSDVFVSSITTGSVVVKGIFNQFTTGNASISASGTGGFTWIAVGM